MGYLEIAKTTLPAAKADMTKGRCSECRDRITAGAQDSLCRRCPAWRPLFARVVPHAVMQRVRAMRACPACRRLGAPCHAHYIGPEPC